MFIHVSRRILPEVKGLVQGVCAHCRVAGSLERHESTITGWFVLTGRSVDALVCPACQRASAEMRPLDRVTLALGLMLMSIIPAGLGALGVWILLGRHSAELQTIARVGGVAMLVLTVLLLVKMKPLARPLLKRDALMAHPIETIYTR